MVSFESFFFLDIKETKHSFGDFWCSSSTIAPTGSTDSLWFRMKPCHSLWKIASIRTELRTSHLLVRRTPLQFCHYLSRHSYEVRKSTNINAGGSKSDLPTDHSRRLLQSKFASRFKTARAPLRQQQSLSSVVPCFLKKKLSSFFSLFFCPSVLLHETREDTLHDLVKQDKNVHRPLKPIKERLFSQILDSSPKQNFSHQIKSS